MRTIQVKVIKAFSSNHSGGNPAGVVFNADRLTNVEKQAIASNLQFPETAFVSSSQVADYKLEFFTPLKQIPHCGHATIAAFSFLRQAGHIDSNTASKETIDGIRAIHFNMDKVFMEQSGPVFSPPAETVKELVAALGIAEADLYNGLLPTIANTGNSFLLIPLASEHILKEIQPDMEKLKQISQTNALIGVYPFALTTDATHAHATARMFGPYYGIDEEAATGMAAGPLACFLYVNQLVRKEQIIIEQGRYMPIPSPSQLIANLSISSDSIASVFVGGSAYVESEMIIHY